MNGQVKQFARPDEIREFPQGRLELVNIGGAAIGRAIFEPGWRWATSVQPIAKTRSCEAPHFQYHVSGVLRIRMDDGQVSKPVHAASARAYNPSTQNLLRPANGKSAAEKPTDSQKPT